MLTFERSLRKLTNRELDKINFKHNNRKRENMVANLIILLIVFGYCGFVLRHYHKKKKNKTAGGCSGCCGSCSGCSGLTEETNLNDK